MKRFLSLILTAIMIITILPQTVFATAASEADCEAQEGGESGADPAIAGASSAVAMYRLYNPNSGEHFFTSSKSERDYLDRIGWNYEGIAWYAPGSSSVPVYRMYNPNAGEHHYTMDSSERDMLVKAGWNYEGIGWHSDPNKAVPLYRVYNKNAFANNHHYTTGKDERDWLVSLGWKSEGIGWYGVKNDTGMSDDHGAADKISISDLEKLTAADKVDVAFNENGNVNCIEGPFTDQKVTSKESAAKVLNATSTLIGDDFSAGASDLDVEALSESAGTERFYRYSPKVNGVPVLGSQVVLSVNGSGSTELLLSSYNDKIKDVDTTASIKEDSAKETALNALLQKDTVKTFLASLSDAGSASETLKKNFKQAVNVSAEKMIDAVGDEPALVYAVRLYGAFASSADENAAVSIDETYYVAANGSDAGKILRSMDNLETDDVILDWTTPSGDVRAINATKEEVKHLLSTKNEYSLKDTKRNITTYLAKRGFGIGFVLPGEVMTFTDDDFSQPSKRTGLTNALYAHSNMGKVYDYYKNVLGRKSYDGNGAVITVTVGYNSMKDNAYWSSNDKQMVFGTGNRERALDTCGHEFTHAVIDETINGGLYYYSESGALNESYADIMGSLIENKDDAGRWTHGEDKGSVTRSFSEPKKYGQAEKYSAFSDKDWSNHLNTLENRDNEGVHVFSGIFNFAAYKMMTASATSSISKEKWAKLFYQSLFRLTFTSNFLSARRAIINTAKTLGFNSSEIKAIEDAFDAVGIIPDSCILGEVTFDAAMSESKISEVLKTLSVELDDENGNLVKLVDENGNSLNPTQISSDEKFYFDGLDGGKYTVYIVKLKKDGKVICSETIGVQKDSHTIVTLPYSALAKLEGYVYDENHDPLPGVSVKVYENVDVDAKEYASTVTDSSGYYTFDALPENEYDINYFADQYSDELLHIEVTDAMADAAEAGQATKLDDITMRPAYYKLYADHVLELEAKHGKARIDYYDYGGNMVDYWISGIALIRLLDMNHDGIKELFIGYEGDVGSEYPNYYKAELCTFDGEKLVTYQGNEGQVDGNRYQYYVFYDRAVNDTVWLNTTYSMPSDGYKETCKCISLQNGKFVETLLDSYPYASYTSKQTNWQEYYLFYCDTEGAKMIPQAFDDTLTTRRTLGISDDEAIRDGVYYTNCRHYSANSKTLSPYINTAKIEDGALVISGALRYSAGTEYSYENAGNPAEGTYVFPVNENTRYCELDGEDDEGRLFYYSQAQYNNFLSRFGGLGLFIYVENGVVTKMVLSP